jgi:hypothetical protein
LAGIAATQAKRALACRHPLSAVEGGGRLDPVPTEPVGAEKVVRLCDLRTCVLVDQTAKPLTPVDNEVIGRRRRRGSPGGRCLAEGTVRPVGVVVVDVDREDEVELAAVDDQDPVEELPAEAADPSLGDRVRSGRADRGAHDLDAFGTEHGVERGGELAVAVPDQVLEPAGPGRRGPSVGPGRIESPTTRSAAR